MKSFVPPQNGGKKPDETVQDQSDELSGTSPAADWTDLDPAGSAPGVPADPVPGREDEPLEVGQVSDTAAALMKDQHEPLPESVRRQPAFPGQPVSDDDGGSASEEWEAEALSESLVGDAVQDVPVDSDPRISAGQIPKEEEKPVSRDPAHEKVGRTMSEEHTCDWDDWMAVLEAHPGISYHQGEIIRLVGDYRPGDANVLKRAKYILERMIAQDALRAAKNQ